MRIFGERGGKSGSRQVHPQTLHEDLRRRGVGTDIDTHMAHDAQETEQDKGVAKQFETLRERRSFRYRFLMDGRERQGEDSHDTDDGIDREEHFPAQAHVRNRRRSAPHGDIRCEERGDRLDKLTERQRRGEITCYDIRHQRIKRSLHKGVTYTEERESAENEAVTLSAERQNERQDGDEDREKDGFLTTDLIHQHTRRHGEDKEPEEDERGHDVRLRMRQTEVLLHVVGSDTHEVHKAHGEETQHHRQKGKFRSLHKLKIKNYELRITN